MIDKATYHDPLDHVLDMADLITPMAIRVAVTIQLPQAMSAGYRHAEELARRTESHPRVLAKLLDHLVVIGLATRHDDGGVGLTSLGERLSSEAADVVARLAELDLPRFAALAEERLADVIAEGRCVVVGASFFDPLPAGADVYLLSSILADWPDEQAVEILGNCRRALPAGGTVLLSETHLCGELLHPAKSTSVALWLESSMANPDRSLSDLRALAERAGLRPHREWQEGLRSMVELHSP